MSGSKKFALLAVVAVSIAAYESPDLETFFGFVAFFAIFFPFIWMAAQ